MLQSDLCNYSVAYIVLKENITIASGNNDAYDKQLAFKNNAPFINCISKINNTLIDNVKDLEILMPMYSLIEFSASLQSYYGDEPKSGLGGDDNNINYSIK